jgi:hypothetical protein
MKDFLCNYGFLYNFWELPSSRIHALLMKRTVSDKDKYWLGLIAKTMETLPYLYAQGVLGCVRMIASGF